jgi:hypothetical protein
MALINILFYAAYAALMCLHYRRTYIQYQEGFFLKANLSLSKLDKSTFLAVFIIYCLVLLLTRNENEMVRGLSLSGTLAALATISPIAQGRRLDYFVCYFLTFYVFGLLV